MTKHEVHLSNVYAVPTSLEAQYPCHGDQLINAVYFENRAERVVSWTEFELL
jgi:hypothetical protein